MRCEKGGASRMPPKFLFLETERVIIYLNGEPGGKRRFAVGVTKCSLLDI